MRNPQFCVSGKSPWSQRLSWNSYCWNRRHHLIMDSSHCRCGHHQRLFHSLIPLSTLFIRSSYWLGELEWYSELYTSQLNNWFLILCCWSSQCVIWYAHYPMLPFQFIQFVHVNPRWHLLLMSVWHFIKGEVFCFECCDDEIIVGSVLCSLCWGPLITVKWRCLTVIALPIINHKQSDERLRFSIEIPIQRTRRLSNA